MSSRPSATADSPDIVVTDVVDGVVDVAVFFLGLLMNGTGHTTDVNATTWGRRRRRAAPFSTAERRNYVKNVGVSSSEKARDNDSGSWLEQFRVSLSIRCYTLQKEVIAVA